MIDPWNAVFTKLKTELGSKYTSLNATTSDSGTPPKYPCIMVNVIGGVERGATIENNEVVAIKPTFEIQVYSTKNLTEARNIMNDTVDLMKSMHMNIVMAPYQSSTDTAKRMIARFSRTFTDGYTL